MTTVAPITAPPPTGNDFADWLSPILVKELRQGLKSRVFVATFIIVQVVMILLVGFQLLALAGGAERGMLDTFDGFFWAFVWLPLLVMMPARGLTAVSEEVKANTLDLVQLTRLTAFRIVLGKWIALVSQTLLLVAAILPYAVLRYFFGEVDVVSDLRNIGLMLLSSVTLTAGAVALSSAPLVVRILVLVVGLPTMLIGAAGIAAAMAFGGRSSLMIGVGTGWAVWLVQFAMTAVYVLMLLEIAAARIAPLSENHAARKRLIALGVVPLLCAETLLLDGFNYDLIFGSVFSAALIWGWVTLEALTERTVMVPSVYRSFARRGFIGRLAGRVLYPGWASGLVFAFVLMVLSLGVSVLVIEAGSSEWPDFVAQAQMVFPIGFTAVVTPVIFHLWFKRMKQPIWLYILVQALFGLLFVIASIAAETPKLSDTDAYRWLAPFPTSALFALMNQPDNAELHAAYTFVTLPVCGVILAYLAVRAVMEFRVISRLERESQDGGRGSPKLDAPAL